jgi:hypothetical protein
MILLKRNEQAKAAQKIITMLIGNLDTTRSRKDEVLARIW